MKHASATSFYKILTTSSIESCAEPSTLKNKHNVKKKFNVSTILSSSRKSSSTFHKFLQEKQIIMPARHSDHVSSLFSRVIQSDDESNVLSIPSTSEPKSLYIPHVLPSENEDILPNSES